MPSKVTAWEAASCPFLIEFDPAKLDEIRLAVVDGFYAVPRGGIEIGGVLFGAREGQRLSVHDYKTIECEHRTGPSFQLSEKDRAGLTALLNSGHGEVLGWFHSHTRSDIFLSAEDLALYNNYFPEPWHIALVLRPGNMQPTRAGYFFRDPSGKISAESSALEFVVEPLLREEPKKVRAVVPAVPLVVPKLSPPPAPKPAPVPPPPPTRDANTRDAKPEPPAPEPIAEPVSVPVNANYSDLEHELETRRQGWWVWVAAMLAIVILGICAYLTRAAWMPQPAPLLKLQASEVEGKLFVRWNPVPNSPGKLTISEGGEDHIILLDAVQIGRGFYVYTRQAERTRVRMKAGESEDTTVFTGPLPPTGPTPEEIEKTRANEKVKTDLDIQNSRNRALQRKVKELNNKLQEPRP